MPPLHLAAGSFLEALGCAFVRFQFRHSSSESGGGRSRPRTSGYSIATVQLLWNRWRDSRPSSAISLSLPTNPATQDSEHPLQRPQPAPPARLFSPALTWPAPFFPATSFPVARLSLSAWLLSLFPFPLPPPLYLEQIWGAAYFLPAAAGTPQYSVVPRP